MPKTPLAALAVALVLIVVAAPALAASGTTRSETSLLREMNRVRVAHGLATLRFDGRLQRAARWHSREMIGSNVFQHGAFGTRMQHFKVTGRLAGENLAWGTGSGASARGIVRAWLASPEHRANLLRPSFTRVGVGGLVGSFQGYSGAHVVTADFAG